MRKVAAEVGGMIAVPQLEGEPLIACDFNDLHQAEGLEAVRAAIEGVLNRADELDPIVERPDEKPDECQSPRSQERHTMQDFWAHLPTRQYIHVSTCALWPAASVDSLFHGYTDPHTKKAGKASVWFDKNRAVDQMVWHPGRARVVACTPNSTSG